MVCPFPWPDTLHITVLATRALRGLLNTRGCGCWAICVNLYFLQTQLSFFLQEQSALRSPFLQVQSAFFSHLHLIDVVSDLQAQAGLHPPAHLLLQMLQPVNDSPRARTNAITSTLLIFLPPFLFISTRTEFLSSDISIYTANDENHSFLKGAPFRNRVHSFVQDV